MSFNLTQINRQKVKAIPLPYEEKKPVRGCDVCCEPYANIFCVAKKKSGKTSVIHHLLKECTGKKTTIIIFCSSIYKDKNWIAIRKWIEKRGNPHEFFTSIKEDGQDQIMNLVEDLSNEAKEREEKEDNEEEKQIERTDAIFAYFEKHNVKDEEKKEKKPRKDKYITPEYFIILDDIGSELHTPSLLKLLRENRHYLCKVVISSQYLNHLKPESRKQLDVWIIFKGLPEAKILEIYKDADISIPFEQFYAMYKKATKVKPNSKFPFFYVDVRTDDFRRNFNTKIELNSLSEEE